MSHVNALDLLKKLSTLVTTISEVIISASTTKETYSLSLSDIIIVDAFKKILELK